MLLVSCIADFRFLFDNVLGRDLLAFFFSTSSVCVIVCLNSVLRKGHCSWNSAVVVILDLKTKINE